jgi:hypothetical protein
MRIIQRLIYRALLMTYPKSFREDYERELTFQLEDELREKSAFAVWYRLIPDTVGLVNSSGAKMAAPKSDPPRNWTTRATPLHDRCAEDVDRLLEDQFDSHLSPLRTGMSSRSFRLRAVRIGDGDRRLAG